MVQILNFFAINPAIKELISEISKKFVKDGRILSREKRFQIL